MSDLPTVVEETLNQLDSLDSQAKSAVDSLQRSSGFAREWQDRTQRELSEFTPRSESLLQKLEDAEQSLGTDSTAFAKVLETSESQVKSWGEEVLSGLKQDSESIASLQSELRNTVKELTDFNDRIESVFVSSGDRLKQLLKESSQAVLSAETSAETLLTKIAEVRSKEKQRCESFFQGLAQSFEQLSAKTEEVGYALEALTDATTANLSILATSAEKETEAVLAASEKAVNTLPDKAVEEGQKAQDALKVVDSSISEGLEGLKTSAKEFQEKSSPVVPRYEQLVKIPGRLEVTLKKGRVI